MIAGAARRRLIGVWLAALTLGAVIVAIKVTDDGGLSEEDAHAGPRMLLPAPVDQLSAVEIAYADAFYRFDRDASGAWFYHAHGADPGTEGGHEHQTDPTQAEFIERGITIFGRTRLERDVARGGSGEAYGVDRPAMIVMVYGADPLQPLARYLVGDIAPDTVSRYVMIHDAQAVVTIPDYHIDNLIELIDGVSGAGSPAGSPEP